MGATNACCQAKSADSVEHLESSEWDDESIKPKRCLTHEEFITKEASRKSRKFLTNEEFVTALAGVGKHARIDCDLIETILFIPDDDSENEVKEDQPKKKVKDRKSTGFVTKDMVDSANARQPGFNDAAGEDKENKPLSAIGKRIKIRKGTPAVSKQKLLEVLDDIDDEEELPKPKTKQTKVKQRKGTGFVTKEKLKKLLATLGQDEE